MLINFSLYCNLFKDSTMTTLIGSCVCGEITFSVEDQFAYAGYCHCSLCRKSSGASGTAIGGVLSKYFKITKGQQHLKRYHRSADTVSCFCGLCGSTLFGEKPSINRVHIRYGALNTSPSLLPQAHMHVASKADWYEITDLLPQFEAFPPQ